jgi:hypothetical protein
MRNHAPSFAKVAPSPLWVRERTSSSGSVTPSPCAAMMMAVMVISINLFDGRVLRNSNGRIRPEGRLKPRSPSRNGFAGFFPLPRRGGIPREAKKPAAAVLRCAAGLTAAGRSLPGPRTAIEAAMVAAR